MSQYQIGLVVGNLRRESFRAGWTNTSPGLKSTPVDAVTGIS
jgi:hypothetical protein